MKLNPDIVPSTIEQAVDMLVAGLDNEERQWIKDGCPPKRIVIKNEDDGTEEEFEVPISLHHGLGTNLRNGWSLWEPDSPLKRNAVEKYKIAHADDISYIILEWTVAKAREESFDPIVFCERIHKHWLKAGFKDSLDAGGWPPKSLE